MQTASAPLHAALTSRERTVAARVKVDWNRDGSFSFDPGVARDIASDTVEGIGDIGDLSAWIESVSVDRSLSTDLPANAKVASGFGAAEGVVTVSGTVAGFWLSSVLSGGSGGARFWRRLGAPITIDVGAVGSSGVEYLRQFTGKIRSVEIGADESSVTLSALDGREKLRTPVSFPVTVGQTGDYFMGQVATQNGLSITSEGSLNTGLATASTDSLDPWETLQQLAAAELGSVLFDENDVLRFYNRNHMSGGSAVATLTTDPTTFANLKAAAASESLDAISNYVSVSATPITLDPPNTPLWDLSEAPLGINPYASLVLQIDLPAPLFSANSITYDARPNSDGSGASVAGNVTAAYTPVTPTLGRITMTNRSGAAVFLVDATGAAAVSLTGRLLRPQTDSGYSTLVVDPPSATAYGAQTLDVATNPWRQSTAIADALAASLLTNLKDPHSTLSGVEIVGDPRLQLMDRVRIQERDGLQVDADFWLTGITTRFSTSDGLVQTVTVREA